MFLTDAYTQPHVLVQEFTFNDDPIERKNNNLSSGSVRNIKAKTTMQKYEDRIKLVEVCGYMIVLHTWLFCRSGYGRFI